MGRGSPRGHSPSPICDDEGADQAVFLDTLTDQAFVKSNKTGLKPPRCS